MVQTNFTKVKTQKYTEKNPLESLRDLGTSTAKNTADAFGKIGGGMLDQFFGGADDHEDDNFGSDSTYAVVKNLDKNLFKIWILI